jgi:hypothetical protein
LVDVSGRDGREPPGVLADDLAGLRAIDGGDDQRVLMVFLVDAFLGLQSRRAVLSARSVRCGRDVEPL